MTVVYVNACQNDIPFATSDNPVLVESMSGKAIGLFHNGLLSPGTCIFFPLSPTIAIANYSNHGIMGLMADELDGRKILINDKKYILDKNIKIAKQAHHHSFIPQPLFAEIVQKEQ